MSDFDGDAEIIDKADATPCRGWPDVLELPPDGGAGLAMLLLFGLALWHSVKGDFADKTVAAAGGAVFPADAVDRLRGGLVRRRIRPPAVDDLRRAADPPVGIDLSVDSLYGSLAGFVGFYTMLLIVEMFLMVRFRRQGPGSLGTGRYANEAHA